MSSFGFGADHDASLLRSIADRGRGSFAYIDTPEAVCPAFGAFLGNAFTIVAQQAGF